jgi:hypothetical protein
MFNSFYSGLGEIVIAVSETIKTGFGTKIVIAAFDPCLDCIILRQTGATDRIFHHEGALNLPGRGTFRRNAGLRAGQRKKKRIEDKTQED